MAQGQVRLAQYLYIGEEPQPAAASGVSPWICRDASRSHGTPDLGVTIMDGVPAHKSTYSTLDMPARIAVASTAPAGTVAIIGRLGS